MALTLDSPNLIARMESSDESYPLDFRDLSVHERSQCYWSLYAILFDDDDLYREAAKRLVYEDMWGGTLDAPWKEVREVLTAKHKEWTEQAWRMNRDKQPPVHAVTMAAPGHNLAPSRFKWKWYDHGEQMKKGQMLAEPKQGTVAIDPSSIKPWMLTEDVAGGPCWVSVYDVTA